MDQEEDPIRGITGLMGTIAVQVIEGGMGDWTKLEEGEDTDSVTEDRSAMVEVRGEGVVEVMVTGVVNDGNSAKLPCIDILVSGPKSGPIAFI